MIRRRASPYPYEALYSRVMKEQAPTLDFTTAEDAKRFVEGWYAFMSRRRKRFPSTTVNVGVQTLFQGQQVRLVVTHIFKGAGRPARSIDFRQG